jgi:hypothetical protein
MIRKETDTSTDFKVVNELVFTFTKGTKKYKLFGITVFKRVYDERPGEISFISSDDVTGTAKIGFSKASKD